MSAADTPHPSGSSPRASPGLLRRVAAAGVWGIWLLVCLLGLGAVFGYTREQNNLHYGWPWRFACRQTGDHFITRWQFWDEPDWVSPLALTGNLLLWLSFTAGGTMLLRRWLSSPRPWQLTLPRLFVLVGIVALGTALWQHGRHDQRVLDQLERFHQQDLEWLQRHVSREKAKNSLFLSWQVIRYECHSWWKELTGAPWPNFFRVTHYALRSLDLGRDLALVVRFSELESLYVSLPQVEPALRRQLAAQLPRRRFAPDPEQWTLLRRLPYLTHLTVDGCNLGGADMAAIARVEQLEYLALPRNPITDQDLAALTPLRNLEELDLSFTQVTDHGVPLLLKLPRLKLVDLTGTQVTDAGVALLESQGISVVDD